MKTRVGVILAILSALVLASCANTIRGIGRDVEQTAEAVEDLG
jgi:predicted small secreted protein